MSNIINMPDSQDLVKNLKIRMKELQGKYKDEIGR
jgi:hypothetical protein